MDSSGNTNSSSKDFKIKRMKVLGDYSQNKSQGKDESKT